MQESTGCQSAWILSVDMGYGHQRAAFPFRTIARERIITANDDQMISPKERRYWDSARRFYEFISRLRNHPGWGEFLFKCYDRLQAISPFYPFRDLSRPTPVVYFLKRRFRQGLCHSLIEYIRREERPILTTHFIPALAADFHGLEKIYCIVTDTDINRVWVAEDPAKSRIIYLAPSRHAMTRLKQYGVPAERIILTGFPLPQELTGVEDEVLRHDLGRRLPNLDPCKRFLANYKPLLLERLGPANVHEEPLRPLTITYLVGGAGAQREIGVEVVRQFKDRLNRGEMRVNLVAGTRFDVFGYFQEQLQEMGIRQGVEVIFAPGKFKYFEKMDLALRETDIIWTKPSELIFYTALGFPVIMSPPVGAHEEENRQWLSHIGSGFIQEDVAYVNDWLFYILESGKFAEAAWDGYMNAPVHGTRKILELLNGNHIPQ